MLTKTKLWSYIPDTKTVCKTLCATFLLYWVPLLIIDVPSMVISKKIHNESELEFALKKEKEKLGIQNKNIKANLTSSFLNAGQVRKNIEDSSYNITLGYFGHNEANLKHELYHIAARHCEGEHTYFVEPSTILYQSFGVRLDKCCVRF